MTLGKHYRDFKSTVLGNWLPVFKPIIVFDVKPSKKFKT